MRERWRRSGLPTRIGSTFHTKARCWRRSGKSSWPGSGSLLPRSISTLSSSSRTMPRFRDALRTFDFVTADGFPIVWACGLAGAPVERTTGADLVVPVARCAAELGVPVSLVGTTQEVLDQAMAELRALAPGLRTGLLHAPRMGFSADTQEASDILARLDALGPNVCFLALGAPKQEMIAARGRGLAPQTGFMCVGAGIDFIAGEQTRASPLVRALNLEWAWRLVQEPRRLFVRYVRCILALPSLLGSALRARYA